MPEVFFVNVNLREGINTDQITSARRKLVSSTDFFLFNVIGKVNVCFVIVSRPVLFFATFFSFLVTLCCFLCHALFFCLCLTFFAFIMHFSVDYITLSCVFLSGLQKCFYCRSTASGKENGACVQCCAGKCAVSFHVTCLVLAGFALEPSDWPQPTETYCERHQRTRFKVNSLCETCNKQFSTG